MLNKKLILNLIGFLLIVEGILMLIPAVVSIIYHENDLLPFLKSSVITTFIGFFLWFITRNVKRAVGKREGFIIVTIVWIIYSVFGSLPYILSGSIPSFTNAFFETISGFTTTGASILNDIEALPHGILFWRSMTHLIGGMGILVLTVAILPFLGVGGMQLFNAEASGITSDKLHPKMRETARRLWGIYLLLIFIETILLKFGGMSLFDALCHSFGTLASGGFSTKNASIAAFSPYIQYVVIFFMILAGTNFNLHYYLIKGKFRKIFKNQEYKFYILIILISTIIIAFFLVKNNGSIEKSFRDALFQVTSIVTCTGFVTADYTGWAKFLWFFIFILMFVGGSVGSTSGGIKVLRHFLLFKNTITEFKRMLHPSAVIPVRYNGNVISNDIIFKVQAFFLSYLVIFITSSLLLTFFGMDFVSSMGAIVTTMGGIGPGLGTVGPVSNFALVPTAGKWLLSFMMLIGRLEIFSVIIVFTPAFWEK
ncbi:MAG: TrkH family potassium uptake protein [Bacteroidetes bacterium]|nr:MAG: TrkH family potassium uptake protein [Bacteroidota bacterium]